jgi:hypothetical protein
MDVHFKKLIWAAEWRIDSWGSKVISQEAAGLSG